VVIYGVVEGNIRATGRIELRDSAVVKGDIVAERLSIEENATIKARWNCLRSLPGPVPDSGRGGSRGADRNPLRQALSGKESRKCSRVWRQGQGGGGGAAHERVPRYSSGWGQLLERMRGEESLRVLDIGPTSSTNINFVTALGHSIYLANLVEEAAKSEWIVPQEDGSPGRFDVEGFLAAHLNFSGRGFDVVLFWDTADYLPQELLGQPWNGFTR